MGYEAMPEDERVRAVLFAVLDRRSRGEDLPDDRVIAEHPDLMPRLAGELAALRRLDAAALLAARGRGDGGDGRPAHPVVPLTEEELERPIVFDIGPDAGQPTAGAGGGPWAARARPSLPGYRIVNEVSAGGQAVVYKAVQEVTGRTAAVKVLTGGPLASSRQRVRFEREVAVLAGLSHPNLVGILDRGYATDGSPYLVMDYVEGRSLDEWLSARPGVDDRLVMFVKLCEAVETAHARGVAHRDLKPSNVRVDGRGEPHVLDFGLATSPLGEDVRRRCVTATGQVVGSLPWASPEQATGGAADARSDVYAIGVMLYVALTGRFPYPVTGGPAEVVDHIVMSTPAAPGRRVRPGEPISLRKRRGLDGVVLKALRKRPAERYPSAGALGRDLARVLVGQDPEAVPPRRWPAPLAISIIVGLAAVGGWRLIGQIPAGNSRGGGLHGLPPPATWPVPTPAFVNSLKMRFARIEPGEFTMGSPPEEEGRDREERQHRVRITRPFLLAMTETTRDQYHAVMGGEAPPDGTGDLPVGNVTAADAEEFCRRLGALERRHYRLPTEAEWEYACRAGTTGAFAGDPDQMAWHSGTRRMGDGPSAVARKRPNAWGLYDMHGNVREWCGDAFAWYDSDPATDPVARPEDHRKEPFRITRGGDYTTHTDLCRSARRIPAKLDNRQPTLGFRVVLDPSI